jgi:outer membrane protein assembly factor BamB
MDRLIRHLRRRSGQLAAGLALGMTILLTLSPAAAQVLTLPAGANPRMIIRGGGVHFGGGPNGMEPQGGEELIDSLFLPADRATLQQLSRARKWLAEGHYSDAIQCLDRILESPDDYFFQPDKQVPIHRSLKAEAQRLLGQMPPAGRELYELHSGRRAQRILDEALASGDAAKLADVSGRYFHTRAGYEATYLLGLYDLDHGLPLAGALTLRRLRDAPDGGSRFEPALTLAMAAGWLDAGAPDVAQQALVALKAERSKLPLTIGGRQVSWFDKDAEAAAWLTQLIGSQRTSPAALADRWLMFRGDAARNVAAAGGAPLLDMCWRVATLMDVEHAAEVEEGLHQRQQLYQENGEVVLSGLHPLVVDNLVLMRDLRTLLAIDFRTGKRLWEVPADDPLEGLASKSRENDMAWRQSFPWMVSMLAQRVWEDGTYGTLSSDGRYVFSIEDLSLAPNLNGNPGGGLVFIGGPFGGVMRVPGGSNHGPSNRLAASDLHAGGKRVWQIGGPAGGPFALRQAGSIFLGPPLPLRGQLFVLAEVNDEIRLLALDAETGNTLWSQQLAVVQRNVFPDALRRSAGLSPSYADGILICPTGAGAVVAIDLATRSLRWGYRYGREKNPNPVRQQQFMAMQFGGYANGAPTPRWLDGTATIVDGRVLITPPETDAMYGLNLVDGEPLWEPLPRQDDLYLACVHAGKVVLVGRHGLHAVNLSDGKPAWEGRSVPLPAGSAPSGRGFLTGNCYYLPLSSAEVAAVDLDAGKIVQTSKSREGSIPGNLVCYQGKVISQSWDGLEVYFQADALREEISRRLAAKPEDAEALRLHGEMLLDGGKLAEAIESFRHAYQAGPDQRTRELLRDSLLDGLRTNFAGYRGRTNEIERLLDEPAQRAAYLRLMADGLQSAGQWRDALDHYLRLIDLDRSDRGMEVIDGALVVRRGLWIRSGLAALRRQAPSETAGGLDRLIGQRLQAALETKSAAALRSFLEYFDGHPAAATARTELIRRLTADKHALEAEMLLWEDRQSPDRAVAGPAVAALAQLLEGAGNLEGAAACYRQLQRQFADLVCRDGKNGKQLVEAIPQDGPLGRLLGPAAAWPRGLVETALTPSNQRTDSYGRFLVQYQGDPGPFYAGMTLRFDQNRSALLVQDGFGRELQRWQLPLTDRGQRMTMGYNPNLTKAYVQGHLLVLPVGSKIFGLDPAGLAGAGKKQLWSQDLTDGSEDSGKKHLRPAGAAAPLGMPPFAMGQYQFRMNPVGAVSPRCVCFQRLRNLVAVDPLSGELLWARHDIPPGSEVFGDDQYIFVLLPPQPNAAGGDIRARVGAPGAARMQLINGMVVTSGAGGVAGATEALVLRARDGVSLGKRSVPAVNYQGISSGGGMSNFGMAMAPGPVGSMPIVGDTCLATLGRKILTWRNNAASWRSEELKGRLELFDPWTQQSVWPARTFHAAARVALAGEEAVGVLEPDGHFVLVELPSGRTIADLKLEPDHLLSEIFLVRSGAEYLLLTQGNTREPAFNPFPAQALGNMTSHFIPAGRLYAIDLQGKLLWPAPVKIRGRWLPVSQPAEVPVITFAHQQFEQRQPGRWIVKTCVRCIDKRSGRIVYQNDQLKQTYLMEIVGDPEKKTVELRMLSETVTLTFTDKPIPPRPPGQTAAGDDWPTRSKIANALWKALDKSLQGAMQQ